MSSGYWVGEEGVSGKNREGSIDEYKSSEYNTVAVLFPRRSETVLCAGICAKRRIVRYIENIW